MTEENSENIDKLYDLRLAISKLPATEALSIASETASLALAKLVDILGFKIDDIDKVIEKLNDMIRKGLVHILEESQKEEKYTD